MVKERGVRYLRYVLLFVSLLALLGSVGTTEASIYSSLIKRSQTPVSSPEVILQNGTAGSSLIYTNSTSARVSVEAPLFDYVDSNDPDVDSSTDKGQHSNFSAQQAGPDLIYDTLTEESQANTYSLNATGGYMIIGDGTPDWGSTAGTISFWVKMDGSVQGRLLGQDGSMETRWSGTYLILDWGGTTSMTSAYSFSADTWYFVAIVWDENNDNLFLYIGDENNAPTLDSNSLSGTWTSTTPTPTENRFMNGLGGAESVDGQGDDLRYWNIARNLTEIQSDYNITLSGSESNLQSYFKLDNSFDDIGPNNDDGSGSGSYSFSTSVPFAGEADYTLDLEVQWTSADYDRTNEELCIETGTFSGSENIQVKVWNSTGSSWHWIMNLTASLWNNMSITPYLTSNTLTVQFLGGTETSDTTQDSWNIDATLLHVWTNESNWLPGWSKRVKITIGHNDIDSDLSDFPILVHLSSSSGCDNDDATFVFDEVGSNSKKIAVTQSNGTTQCYVEIESWNSTSEQAWLWVKAPSISSTANTDLYLYYDSSQSDNTAYVGDKGSTPAQNVWNADFNGVWHLDEDPSGTPPQMKDSTSNNHNGTSNGTMTSNDQITGKIDGSLDFDGIDDYIQTTSNELKTLDNFTLSVWFKADSTTTPQHMLWEGPASQNGWGDGSSQTSHEMHLTLCKFDANNTLIFFYGYEAPGGDWVPAIEINVSFSDTTNWNHAVVVMTGASTSPSAELFLNGVSQGTDTGTQTNRTAWDTNLRIGRPGTAQRLFDGMIDEVRILETARSVGWIKASYESERDNLLDFGASGSSEGTYDYVFRVNNTATDSWQTRLKSYSDSNINRLDICTIYFYNSTNGVSNQIIVDDGNYIQDVGPWFDLRDSETIYIAVDAEASFSGTSIIYVYLEILTPGTTTYAQYILEFRFT